MFMSLKADPAHICVTHANPKDGIGWLTGGENSIIGTSSDFIIQRSTKRPLNMDTRDNLSHVFGDGRRYKRINHHKMALSCDLNWK